MADTGTWADVDRATNPYWAPARKQHYTHFSLWLEGLPLDTPLDVQPSPTWTFNTTAATFGGPFGNIQFVPNENVPQNQVWFVAGQAPQAQQEAHRRAFAAQQQQYNALAGQVMEMQYNAHWQAMQAQQMQLQNDMRIRFEQQLMADRRQGAQQLAPGEVITYVPVPETPPPTRFEQTTDMIRRWYERLR